MQHTSGVWLGVLLVMSSSPIFGHHSGAMFDRERSVTLVGTVMQFQWTNPHCWIQLAVVNGQETTEWSIEMGQQSELYRSGWRPGTLRTGQTIRVTVNPLRRGSSAGGLFVSATDADGAAIGAPATWSTRDEN